MGISFAEIINFKRINNLAVYSALKKLVLANATLVPFVGAGLSVGICPTWKDLLLKIAKSEGEFFGKGNTYLIKVQSMLNDGDYEGAASYLSAELKKIRFLRDVQLQIEGNTISWEKIQESCKILPELFSGGVITTNFDHVIRFVYREKGKDFEDTCIPRSEKDQCYIDRVCNRNEHYLLKLHGNISQPETLILTKEEYNNNYGNTDYETILELLFLTTNFIFLGCSLNRDRTMKVLSDLVKKKKGRDLLYFAILEAPEKTDDEFERRVKELEASRIQVIWYPHDKHEAVAVILKELLAEKQKALGAVVQTSPDVGGKAKEGDKTEQNRKKKIIRIAIIFACIVAVAVAIPSLIAEQKKQAALAETPTPAATQKATATSKITTPTPRAETFLPAMQDTAVGSVAQGRIAAGSDYTAILLDDGTVLTYGGARSGINTSSWNEIVQISGYDDHIVGLKADGTLVGTGTNNEGDLDIQSWMGVVQVATGYHGTSALTEDGYVLYTGTENANIDDCVNWKDIEILVAGDDHMAGITKDGKMVASGYNSVGQCDVGGFTNIACAAVGCQYTFAVDADGDVSIAGGNEKYAYGQYNAVSWKNIIAIDSGDRHVVGLTKDGKVYAAGENLDGQLNVDKWENVIAICAGQYHTVAISTDGTIYATGRNGDKQSSCNGTKLW